MVPSLIALIQVEVEFDASTSVQFTSVPFRPSFTGLIIKFVISGSTISSEILEKVNVIEFTTISDVAGTDCVCKTRINLVAVVSPSGIRKKLHSANDPGVVHVNSSISPLQAGATPGGVITTPFNIIITIRSTIIMVDFIYKRSSYLLLSHKIVGVKHLPYLILMTQLLSWLL